MTPPWLRRLGRQAHAVLDPIAFGQDRHSRALIGEFAPLFTQPRFGVALTVEVGLFDSDVVAGSVFEFPRPSHDATITAKATAAVGCVGTGF